MFHSGVDVEQTEVTCVVRYGSGSPLFCFIELTGVGATEHGPRGVVQCMYLGEESSRKWKSVKCADKAGVHR